MEKKQGRKGYHFVISVRRQAVIRRRLPPRSSAPCRYGASEFDTERRKGGDTTNTTVFSTTNQDRYDMHPRSHHYPGFFKLGSPRPRVQGPRTLGIDTISVYSSSLYILLFSVFQIYEVLADSGKGAAIPAASGDRKGRGPDWDGASTLSSGSPNPGSNVVPRKEGLISPTYDVPA